jgi:hypothetical protein
MKLSLTLNSGELNSQTKIWAAINKQFEIVGIIENTSPNYATVIVVS